MSYVSVVAQDRWTCVLVGIFLLVWVAPALLGHLPFVGKGKGCSAIQCDAFLCLGLGFAVAHRRDVGYPRTEDAA